MQKSLKHTYSLFNYNFLQIPIVAAVVLSAAVVGVDGSVAGVVGSVAVSELFLSVAEGFVVVSSCLPDVVSLFLSLSGAVVVSSSFFTTTSFLSLILFPS